MQYNLTNSTKLLLLRARKHARMAKQILIYVLLFAIPASMVLVLLLRSSQHFNVVIINPDVSRVIQYAAITMLWMNIAFFIWMAWLAYRKYREIPSVSDAELPSCVVIIPAYNEGKHVLAALESILASDYPREKLEIVAVDDGSCDDTWHWICDAANKSDGRITPLKQPHNKGKRAAIHAGILLSKGDVIITIDSDSVIDTDTLRKMTSPFVGNPKVGGVAGNVRVLNLNDGIIPKMLEVNFLFSFEFIRSAQSSFGAVFCSPGALSAFRRSVTLKFLDKWVNQQFMGKPANIGEDRAMTNMLLADGHDVVFQRSAMVLTIVPDNYRGLCKMLTRWARSNVRENFSMLSFAFNKFAPLDAKTTGVQLNLMMQLIWMIIPLLSSFVYIYCMIATLGMFVLSVAPVALIFALLPAWMYLHRCGRCNALLAYIYAIFYFFTLFWIAPYAILSFHRSGWLTREQQQS